MNAKFVRSSLLLLALVSFTCSALASIEREPVKVDRHNAGPKYDIDDLERTRVLAENSNPDSNQVMTAPMLPPSASRHDNNDRDDNSHQDAPMISVRRIFLVPIMRSHSSSSSSDDDNDRPSDPMRMFGMPPRTSMFSPFSAGHLFGSDVPSRPAPMNPDESQERPVMSSSSSSSGNSDDEQERPRPNSALFDPIEMLMEAMRQALNPANMMPAPESTDLNKEASGDDNSSSSSSRKTTDSETGLEKQADKKPQSFNSTKEDIVEIDGKNPLNETETTEAPAIININKDQSTPTTSEPAAPEPSTTSKVEKIDEPISGSSTISPAASEPVATEAPTSSSEDLSGASSTLSSIDREDITKSIGDRITETASKVERLTEKIIESGPATDKPSS